MVYLRDQQDFDSQDLIQYSPQNVRVKRSVHTHTRSQLLPTTSSVAVGNRTLLFYHCAFGQQNSHYIKPDAMATVLSPTSLLTNSSKPRQIPQRQAVLPPQLKTGVRSGRLNLDTFSPVNQNGSFEFDRVLKSGDLKLRTRKTKVIAAP